MAYELWDLACDADTIGLELDYYYFFERGMWLNSMVNRAIVVVVAMRWGIKGVLGHVSYVS